MRFKIFYSVFFVCLYSYNSVFAQELTISQLETTLKDAKKANNLKQEVQTETAIGDYYFQKKDYKKAESYYKKSVSSNKNNPFIEEAVIAQQKLGLLNTRTKEYKTANQYLKNALQLAEKNTLTDLSTSIKKDIIALEVEIKEQDKANAKYQEFKSLNKTQAVNFIANETNKSELENEKFLSKINNLSKENQLAQLKIRLRNNELSKKELQIELLDQYNKMKDGEVTRKENEIKTKNALLAQKEIENDKQRIIIGYSVAALILLTLLILYVYRANVQRHRHNDILKSKNQIITSKNKEITDSIRYAKRIQEATLLSSNKNITAMSENFILFQPKDIVSGDFYWIRAIDNKIIWAVADCTGHGVPGAFMSMIGNRLLNEIIIEKKVHSANLILDELKAKIILSLNQEGKSEDSKDGMDIAICILDKDTQIVDYAGANNPIYLVKKDIVHGNRIIHENIRTYQSDLIEIKANRFPIGYNPYLNVPFVNFQFKIEKDDVIYMFSDGYLDQFGGDRSKKLTSKRFKEILVSIHELPMSQQKEELEAAFSSWKQNLEQLDDVCVIGVRL